MPWLLTNHPTVTNYEQARYFLHYRRSKPIVNSTVVKVRGRNEIGVFVHDKPVVIYHSEGSCIITDAGERTRLTRDRVDRFSPANVEQKNFIWHITVGNLKTVLIEGKKLWLNPKGDGNYEAQQLDLDAESPSSYEDAVIQQRRDDAYA